VSASVVNMVNGTVKKRLIQLYTGIEPAQPVTDIGPDANRIRISLGKKNN